MPYSEPRRTPAPQSGQRRRTRRRRQRIPQKAILRITLLVAVVICCGLGLTKLLTTLVSESPVVVAQAASPSKSPDTLEEGTAVLTPAGEKPKPSPSKPVKPAAATPISNVMPCYSEDALVVNYLGVGETVTTHPLLVDLHKKVPTASETTVSTTPVDQGGSGVANIATWKNTNSDTIGWLKVPGTNINYPVVQGPYTNYYTSLGYNKQYSKQGVIWADSACGFNGGLSSNTVLYGHNWTNYGAVPRIGSPSDTHFAQLTAFQHLSFAKSHPTIWFSTEGNEMQWQIFAAFYTDIDFNYISASGGQGIIDGAKARSEHIYDVPVSSSDKILTLSTCTRRFGSSNRQRFVIMAKLVDSASSSVSITTNPNPVRPNL